VVITHSGNVQKPSEWPQFSESSRQGSFVQMAIAFLQIPFRASMSCLLARWDRFRLPLPLHTFLRMVKPLQALLHISKYWARAVDLPLHALMGCLSSIATRSIPATPMAAIPPLSHPIHPKPGTPISLETQNLRAPLTLQGSHQLEDSPMSGDLGSLPSRWSNWTVRQF
jgi:hypothetical protein